VEKIRKFLKEEEGVIAVEYALITGFIGLGLVAVIGVWQQQLQSLFNSLRYSLSQDVSGGWCNQPYCH